MSKRSAIAVAIGILAFPVQATAATLGCDATKNGVSTAPVAFDEGVVGLISTSSKKEYALVSPVVVGSINAWIVEVFDAGKNHTRPHLVRFQTNTALLDYIPQDSAGLCYVIDLTHRKGKKSVHPEEFLQHLIFKVPGQKEITLTDSGSTEYVMTQN